VIHEQHVPDLVRQQRPRLHVGLLRNKHQSQRLAQRWPSGVVGLPGDRHSVIHQSVDDDHAVGEGGILSPAQFAQHALPDDLVEVACPPVPKFLHRRLDGAVVQRQLFELHRIRKAENNLALLHRQRLQRPGAGVH
jgi:hypothetical protein